jgi:hypothetical protein
MKRPNNKEGWITMWKRLRRLVGFRGKTPIGKVALGAILLLFAAGVASGAGFWIVSLNSGSSAQGQSATVSNLTITATSTASIVNLLFPGNDGDAIATITNPNNAPVTVTAINLPANTAYAVGYTSNTFATPVIGCDGTTSTVSWSYAGGTSGTSHTLTTPIVIGANSNVAVTLTNDIAMGASAPNACQGTYFEMPSLTGVTATIGGSSSSVSPDVDGWTS